MMLKISCNVLTLRCSTVMGGGEGEKGGGGEEGEGKGERE